jgi:membrane protein implicated in regulation of membrane protease activity
MLAEYIVNHQTEFWLLLGFAMLAIEVVTGFVSGVFLFAGLAALTTGMIMSVGVLPETWTAGVACTGISSGIITALLWRPLKKLQRGRPAKKDDSSDLIGYEFVAGSDLAVNEPGSKLYSGLTWRVEIDGSAGVDLIKAGQSVSVTSVDVGVFKVKPSRVPDPEAP